MTAPAPPRERLALLLLPAVALLAILPLLVFGCSCGHDFDFHLLSWLEAATQFAHGNLHPHWAYTPAFNAGEPRFVFYPPLSWTIGALLGLVLPWSAVPIAYTWLVLTAAGLACYKLLRAFVPQNTALLIASLYMVNPYMLFTAYERTAYAELLAAAWLPLLLYAILRPRVTTTGIAIPIALLWLTNAPAAVIGCYSLALLTIVRIVQERRASLLKPTIAGTLLGIGAAAFYILPAAYERRFVWINMAMVNGMAITDNFLFHHTTDPDHDTVLRTASLIAVGFLLVFGATLLVLLRRKQPRIAPLATLFLGIAFLLTPLSALFWHYAPELAFLQFPWRFLAMLTPALALAIALALPHLRFTAITGLILSAGLIAFGYHAFRQMCYPEDTVTSRVALYHSPLGTDPTDEYTPRTADNDSLHPNNPAFWLAASPTAPPPDTTAAPLRWPLDITSPTAQFLILNLHDYPAWRITVNHSLIPERLPRPDGLIAIPLSAGPAHIEIAYAHSLDESIGWIIFALSVAALLYLLRNRADLSSSKCLTT
ncbi:MAG TPA: hypothetical protein VGC07_04515 [Granulicella sp.]